MCDLVLITFLRPFEDPRPNKVLDDLHKLRTKKGYYFVEYLSQGSLKIENECQKISANVLFNDDRLYRLQPSFAELHKIRTNGNPGWAKPVSQLREKIWPGNDLQVLSSAETQKCLKALNKIMDNIALDWKFPLGIYFQALAGAKITTDELGAEYSHPQTLGSKFIPSLESRFLEIRSLTHQSESHVHLAFSSLSDRAIRCYHESSAKHPQPKSENYLCGKTKSLLSVRVI